LLPALTNYKPKLLYIPQTSDLNLVLEEILDFRISSGKFRNSNFKHATVTLSAIIIIYTVLIREQRAFLANTAFWDVTIYFTIGTYRSYKPSYVDKSTVK
jgi:hypothetical protein